VPAQVGSHDEIIRNALTFDALKAGSSSEIRLHSRCLKNAKYFVVIDADGQRIFAPGNFCMYQDNDFEKRWGIGKRSGGEPSRIMGKVLGDPIRQGDTGYIPIDESFIPFLAIY
jgi:hypothetical protein